mmetsp:Transcript_23351/g.44800  ORF Transcript_23351/g.44800 Transcript_23351/m.44800 type:complete len:82 (-) Transcript_23351:61-306(-)
MATPSVLHAEDGRVEFSHADVARVAHIQQVKYSVEKNAYAFVIKVCTSKLASHPPFKSRKIQRRITDTRTTDIFPDGGTAF